jgi:hypothetical protein
MGIPKYGVWVAHPTHYKVESEKQDPKSPHIYLYFTDGTSTKQYQAAINVKSTDKDTRLVFWLNRTFLTQSPSPYPTSMEGSLSSTARG